MFIWSRKKFSTVVALVGKTVRHFVCATGIPIGLRYILRILAQFFFSGELIGLYIISTGLISSDFLLCSVVVTGNPLYFPVIQLDNCLTIFWFFGCFFIKWQNIPFNSNTLKK